MHQHGFYIKELQFMLHLEYVRAHKGLSIFVKKNRTINCNKKYVPKKKEKGYQSYRCTEYKHIKIKCQSCRGEDCKTEI